MLITSARKPTLEQNDSAWLSPLIQLTVELPWAGFLSLSRVFAMIGLGSQGAKEMATILSLSLSSWGPGSALPSQGSWRIGTMETSSTGRKVRKDLMAWTEAYLLPEGSKKHLPAQSFIYLSNRICDSHLLFLAKISESRVSSNIRVLWSTCSMHVPLQVLCLWQ